MALSLGVPALEGAASSLSIAQPCSLSIQGDSRVSFRVSSTVARKASAHFDLVSKDGLVTEPVFDAVLSLGQGASEFSFAIPPARLASFAVGETVVLKGHVGPLVTEGEIPVTAGVPEASGWTLNVPATAMVYSTADSTLTFRTVNPKNKPVSVNLKLKFKNLKGKVVANWKYPVIALPGESLHSVTVPLSVCNQAKLKGANSMKTLLLKDGNTKAQGQSLLDWDLAVSTSSDKALGNAPLTVSFTALVSGGVAPYFYHWNYGDGSAAGETQNPNHTFIFNGVYSVVLAVVDSRGGTVSAAPLTIVVQ
jgi:PKD repeat protein